MTKFIAIAITIIVLDFLWISFYLYPRFTKMIKNVQNKPMEPKPLGSLVAYIILILFAYIFLPKLQTNYEAFLLGFFTYGIYESTNYATIDHWNLDTAIADSFWGGVLFFMTYEITKNIN